MNNRISKSLGLQLFCAVLISLLVGGVVFAAAFFLGDSLLDKTVYGQTFAETMADPLFLQILEDYAYSLESSGMQVQLQFTPVSGRILATIQLLQRALDNLYSNLTKYASPEETIRICYEKQKNSLCLSISNGRRAETGKQESTSIGLNTCRRIIEYHGGTFETAEKNGRFFVSVTLPLQT